MKNLILILLLASYFTEINAQSDWTLIDETIIKGSINGSITQDYLFQIGREFYLITEKTKQRARARNPKVQIYQSGTNYKLIIEHFEKPVFCKKIKNVFILQILGEFKGWDGETIFNMTNGQTWKQASYGYAYHFEYSPNVLIYEVKGTWRMKVADIDETIQVINLK